ncbi:hypothetical protein SAMN02745170_03870 [Propionispora hippei DSM 15287]|uniref:Uncharacterized protein n=1 Tax=Propionispora hippei DSM 15287 TaxID=1123003 RepID=A0A1M6NU77_9FIRM|nr:hypothetical protein SAMN02745170_03870 [Propionispora hippei DSM 15287]
MQVYCVYLQNNGQSNHINYREALFIENKTYCDPKNNIYSQNTNNPKYGKMYPESRALICYKIHCEGVFLVERNFIC